MSATTNAAFDHEKALLKLLEQVVDAFKDGPDANIPVPYTEAPNDLAEKLVSDWQAEIKDAIKGNKQIKSEANKNPSVLKRALRFELRILNRFIWDTRLAQMVFGYKNGTPADRIMKRWDKNFHADRKTSREIIGAL